MMRTQYCIEGALAHVFAAQLLKRIINQTI